MSVDDLNDRSRANVELKQAPQANILKVVAYCRLAEAQLERIEAAGMAEAMEDA